MQYADLSAGFNPHAQFMNNTDERTFDGSFNASMVERQLPRPPSYDLPPSVSRGVKRSRPIDIDEDDVDDDTRESKSKKKRTRGCKTLSEASTMKRVITVSSNFHRNGNAKNKRRHWARMEKAKKDAILAGVNPRDLVYTYCRHSKWTPPPAIGVLIIEHSIRPNTFLPNDCQDWQTTSIFHLLCMQCGEICLSLEENRTEKSESALDQLKRYVKSYCPVRNLRDGHLRTGLHYVLALCQSKFGGGGRTRGQIWQLCTEFAKFLYDYGFDNECRDKDQLRPSDFATGWCRTVFLEHIRDHPRAARTERPTGLTCAETPVAPRSIVSFEEDSCMSPQSDIPMADVTNAQAQPRQPILDEPCGGIPQPMMHGFAQAALLAQQQLIFQQMMLQQQMMMGNPDPSWRSHGWVQNENNLQSNPMMGMIPPTMPFSGGGTPSGTLPPVGSMPHLPSITSDVSLVSMTSHPSLPSLASFDSSNNLSVDCPEDGIEPQPTAHPIMSPQRDKMNVGSFSSHGRYRNNLLRVGSLGNPSFSATTEDLHTPHNFVGQFYPNSTGETDLSLEADKFLN